MVVRVSVFGYVFLPVFDAVFVFMAVGKPFLWPHEGTLVALFVIHVCP